MLSSLQERVIKMFAAREYQHISKVRWSVTGMQEQPPPPSIQQDSSSMEKTIGEWMKVDHSLSSPPQSSSAVTQGPGPWVIATAHEHRSYSTQSRIVYAILHHFENGNSNNQKATIAIEWVRHYIDFVKTHRFHHLVLVTMETKTFTSQGVVEWKEFVRKEPGFKDFTWELFSFTQESPDLIHHAWVPKHVLLRTKEEYQPELDRVDIKSEQDLITIETEDTQALYLNAKPNQVIRIEFPHRVEYRLVIDPNTNAVKMC